MTVRFAPAARPEAIALGDWFDARRPGAGARFAAALTDLLARVVRNPRMYGRVAGAPRRREVRMGLASPFPAVVVYEVASAEVVVLSVTHARSVRRPWRRRL